MNTAKPGNQDKHTGSEQDLKAVRAAWSELETTEPPELIDQAIMNRARRDLEKPGQNRVRWLGGFATAAVVVVAMTLVLQQEQQFLPPPQKANGVQLELAPARTAKEELRRDEPSTAKVMENEPQAGLQKRRALSSDTDTTAVATQAAASPEAPMTVADALPELAEDEAFTDKAAYEAVDEAKNRKKQNADAEAWIERLRLLRDTQQDEKLVQELAAFRSAFPDYPLPVEFSDY